MEDESELAYCLVAWQGAEEAEEDDELTRWEMEQIRKGATSLHHCITSSLHHFITSSLHHLNLTELLYVTYGNGQIVATSLVSHRALYATYGNSVTYGNGADTLGLVVPTWSSVTWLKSVD